MLSSSDVDAAIEAGRIASKALLYGRARIRRDASLLEVTEQVEAYIREQGAEPAFPVQMSLNDTAAHDVARFKDQRILGEDLVKLDVGVHIDGVIADNALTVDLSSRHRAVLDASKDALSAAMEKVKARRLIAETAQTIHDTILQARMRPIANLSGHGLSRYTMHTSPQIPNIPIQSAERFASGMHFAVEPFATDGYGRVREQGDPELFALKTTRNVRDLIARRGLQIIRRYQGLPFCTRWLADEIGERRAEHTINTLMHEHMLHAYAPLVEVQGGMVSQHERTLVIDADKVIVTTRWDLE